MPELMPYGANGSSTGISPGTRGRSEQPSFVGRSLRRNWPHGRLGCSRRATTRCHWRLATTLRALARWLGFHIKTRPPATRHTQRRLEELVRRLTRHPPASTARKPDQPRGSGTFTGPASLTNIGLGSDSMQWPRSQSGKAKCAARAAAGELLPMPPPPGGNRCTLMDLVVWSRCAPCPSHRQQRLDGALGLIQLPFRLHLLVAGHPTASLTIFDLADCAPQVFASHSHRPMPHCRRAQVTPTYATRSGR